MSNALQFLQLMQLADSAAPIGAVAHSFGVEMLAAEDALTVDELPRFLEDYLVEAGALEAAYCRLANAIATGVASSPSRLGRGAEERGGVGLWLDLLRKLSALKPARESRAASASLGKRFLQMAAGLTGSDMLADALRSARSTQADIHYCAAFGLVAGALELDVDAAVLAYLQQSVTGIVSACQRLMPLGQSRASAILWELKPALAKAASSSPLPSEERASCPKGVIPVRGGPGEGTEVREFVPSFTPLLEMASMRHPRLTTRLFIS